MFTRRFDIEEGIKQAIKNHPGAWRSAVAREINESPDWRQGDEVRSYIGGSSIGKRCDRVIWLQARGISHASDSPKASTQMMWQTGHFGEAQIIAGLRSSGWTVNNRDESGRQYRYTIGNISGAPDGIIKLGNERYVLEVKTQGKSTFSKSIKGILSPEYLGQMALASYAYNIDALFIALCRDNMDIIALQIPRDDSLATSLIYRAEAINSNTPPQTIGLPTSYPCNMCSHKHACHSGITHVQSCSNCVYWDRHSESCSINNDGPVCNQYRSLSW